MGREVGAGFRMGNTCTPMEDSSQCMAKPIQRCKVKKINIKINIIIFVISLFYKLHLCYKFAFQELIGLIKHTKIPIICMCNDRNHPKIRSLVHYCFDLRFQRPRVEQIKV